MFLCFYKVKNLNFITKSDKNYTILFDPNKKYNYYFIKVLF
jgi:hypothetical protein